MTLPSGGQIMDILETGLKRAIRFWKKEASCSHTLPVSKDADRDVCFHRQRNQDPSTAANRQAGSHQWSETVKALSQEGGEGPRLFPPEEKAS